MQWHTQKENKSVPLKNKMFVIRLHVSMNIRFYFSCHRFSWDKTVLWRTCTAAPPPPAAPGPTSSCSPAAARRASTTQRLAPTPKCKPQVAVYRYHFLQEFNVLTIFQRNQADAGSIEAFICNQSFWSSWGSSSGNTPKTQSPSDITMILESAKGSPQYMEVITIQFDGRAPAR